MTSPAPSWPSAVPPQQHHHHHRQHSQTQQPPQMQQVPEDMGLQARPMGLKVHYTFDQSGQINCLARWPHILQVQTVPIDDRNTIGVIDLRTCLQAIAQCSPELLNQQDNDYTVYAYDYSEPDTPLVGQGMLSWGLDYNNDQHQQQQLVTGRVTRNLLAILSNGSREILEVKMRLTAVAKMQQRSSFPTMDGPSMPKSASTPADTTSTEWNSFIQSNPMLGHSGNVASIPSPALPTAHLNTSMSDSRPMEMRTDYSQHPPLRPASIPPPQLAPAPIPSASIPPATNTRPTGPPPAPDNAPSPTVISTIENPVEKQARPASRPSSRASRRSRVPTGRPRGRPRKNPLDNGNTSAAEEATTDGDDGPQKKRAKITKAEYSAIAPFVSAPESLRVAASTSGSLRNMRPIGSGGSATTSNTGQDVPRAPTPVPDMSRLPKHHMRRTFEKSQSEGMMDSETGTQYQSRFSHPSLSMEGLSPAESAGQSPDAGYTPEDSPGDIGSSPPVPRASAYMRTSPMASSPILPPMPLPQVDSGFMSGGIDDFFDDDELLQDIGQEQGQDLPQRRDSQPPQSAPPMTNKSTGRKNSRPPPKSKHSNFPFHEVNPGPPELLPVKSIFNPAGRTKTLNRVAAAEAAAAAAAGPVAAVPPSLEQSANRVLKRAVTDPTPLFLEQERPSRERSISHQPVLERTHDVSDIQMSETPSQMPQFDDASQSFNFTESQPQRPEVSGNGPHEASPENAFQPPAQALEPIQMPVPERPIPDSVLTLPTKPISRPASRSALAPQAAVPASDPAPEPVLTFPRAFMSEAPCPPSDCGEPARYNKNLVKKQSIKERLESAIEKGEMPPFCNNCGAIETPTWRKIWTQDHPGIPASHEFSDKPGFVTMVEILQRDADGTPSMHQLVKKNLGPKDDKKLWKETLLCNPCGIWLAKFKSHRPSDRWDKDAARLNQPRKKRDRNRSKKSRTKSDAMNPTSEAYFTTDPIGPTDRESPNPEMFENQTTSRQQSVAAVDDDNKHGQVLNDEYLNSNGSPKQSRPGSTHSRGSGTAGSPIAVEDDLGPTRRLLFPSPRKDGVPKVLGELAVNIVQTTTIIQEAKSAGTGKENVKLGLPEVPIPPATPIIAGHDDLEQELFGTPPRPSTPPPKGATGPFKTPTRATPSHRPVTRSISRSIAKSPGQALLQLPAQRTPSKTPRSTRSNNTGLMFSLGGAGGSATKRRSPRHAHFALNEEFIHSTHFGSDYSPFTASLNQLLSEANEFTHGSPSHGLVDLDLSALPNMSMDDPHGGGGMMDFGTFLSTDLVMPSSPPLMRNHAVAAATATVESMWVQMTANPNSGVNGDSAKKGDGA